MKRNINIVKYALRRYCIMQELKPDAILYRCDINDSSSFFDGKFPQCEKIYEEIKKSIEINKEGYNLFIIDDFSNEKLKGITSYVEKLYNDKQKPCDICYVIYDDEKSPKPLFLSGGMGKLFKESVKKIIESYTECSLDFYNNENEPIKMAIIDDLEDTRNEIVGSFIEKAHKNGYEVKSTDAGFAFVALSDIETDNSNKTQIISMLKKDANDMLSCLKEKEIESIELLRKILIKYLETEMINLKKNIYEQFEVEKQALNYFKYIFDNIETKLSDNYSISFEQDENGINQILSLYRVNVLVDNEKSDAPPVIYEDDPTVSKLIGTIEYLNHNGSYDTDSMLIQAGSLLKANGGCLIMRTGSLLTNAGTWNALKKVLVTKKVAYDFNRNYLEILSLGYINPEPVYVNTKVILIGSINEYNALYNYDDEFKNIFKLKAEYNPVIDINKTSINFLRGYVNKLCQNNKEKIITDGAICEIARALSKKAENKNKIYMDDTLIEKIVMLSEENAEEEGKNTIESNDIIRAAYDEEIMEQEICESFKDGRILLNVDEKCIGQVNGLSVLDGGYFRFGRVFKITCSCICGSGDIIDIQKESSLSGRIHNKSINILKGYINNFIGIYERLPVDFHICFEQIYGRVEGDSASVAEAISMISALSKIPVKQNIAVTGSVNQFGEIQPIGGVNDKIEGFYKICESLSGVKNKGVLIPYLNKDDLVLKPNVEDAIEKGEFHIYVMNTMQDAIETMMGRNNQRGSEINRIAKREIKKYIKKEN